MDWQELVPKCFLIMSNPIFLVLTTTNVFTERHTYLFEGQSRESSNDDVEDDSQEGINCLHTAALLRDFQKMQSNHSTGVRRKHHQLQDEGMGKDKS